MHAPPELAEPAWPRGIIYQPFWTLTGNPRLLASHVVAALSSRYSLTPAQVLYAFVHQGFGLPGIEACVLCGSQDETHMAEAVRATQLEPWSDDELEELRREVYGE